MLRPLLAAGCLLLASCAAVPPTEPSVRPDPGTPRAGELRLDFDGVDPLQIWGLDMSVNPIPLNGAELATADAPDGGGALVFPAASDQVEPPGLVLVVSGPGVPDPLGRDFGYGADLRLDPASTTVADDGDNVMQRGLASDISQYKLQVDAGRPSCVVAGPGGRFVAKLKRNLDARWYRIGCELAGGELTLRVTDLEQPGGETQTVTVPADPGELDFEPTTVLSIGRKVTAAGEPVINKPDQFNGLLDAVWVAIAS